MERDNDQQPFPAATRRRPPFLLIATILTTLFLISISLRHGYLIVYTPKEGCARHPRCMFIVSPGRSGSTALLDAMNQMEKVYIRGENAGMMKFLFNLHYVAKRLSSETHYKDVAEELQRYEEYVVTHHKPDWYNEFNPAASLCATRSYFRHLFGYDDFKDYIVGFKEIRFWRDVADLGRPGKGVKNSWGEMARTSLLDDTYIGFRLYLDFHRELCEMTQIVFNYGKEYNFTTGQGFYFGQEKGAQLQRNLKFAERYALQHPNDTMTIFYEDMFDPSVNQSLLEGLGRLMRKETSGITFARLPRV